MIHHDFGRDHFLDWFWEYIHRLNTIGHNPTPTKHKKHMGSTNHARKENKTRRLMAKQSRRINRK